jgi:hypothetical protein
LQTYVEVPKTGPRNRVEPAGLAIITFDSNEDLEKAEDEWAELCVGGRMVQVSRAGFLPGPGEAGGAPQPGPQPEDDH